MIEDEVLNLLAHLHRAIEALETRVADLEAAVAHLEVYAL